jgi:hypothetical protein
MLSLLVIVLNNYLLAPYLHLLGIPYAVLALPAKIWNLLEIGLGGHVVGQSAEKVASLWRHKT